MKKGIDVGETTLTSKNQISLPAEGVRALGWQRGDKLIVQRFGKNMLLLIREPSDWIEEFAGQLDEVFAGPEDVRQYLEGERTSWDRERSRE